MTDYLHTYLQENQPQQVSDNQCRQYYYMYDDVQSDTALFLKCLFQIQSEGLDEAMGEKDYVMLWQAKNDY